MKKVFIVRDVQGNISSLSATASVGASATSIDDPEVQEYLRDLDVDLVRVLEDVVDLLVGRGVFRFTDLPESAQQKLMVRKTMPSHWQAVPDPLAEEEGLL